MATPKVYWQTNPDGTVSLQEGSITPEIQQSLAPEIFGPTGAQQIAARPNPTAPTTATPTQPTLDLTKPFTPEQFAAGQPSVFNPSGTTSPSGTQTPAAPTPIDESDPAYWTSAQILGDMGETPTLNLPSGIDRSGYTTPDQLTSELTQYTPQYTKTPTLPGYGAIPGINVPQIDAASIAESERGAAQRAAAGLTDFTGVTTQGVGAGQDVQDYLRNQQELEDLYGRSNDIWAAIEKQMATATGGLKKAEQSALTQSRMDEAAAARRAAEIGAGAGLGGAFQAGQQQATIEGQQQRGELAAQFAVQRDQQALQQAQLRMDYLNQLEDRAKSIGDRDAMLAVQQQKNVTEREISNTQAQLEASTANLTAGTQREIAAAQTATDIYQTQADLEKSLGINFQNLSTEAQLNAQNIWSNFQTKQGEWATQLGLSNNELKERFAESLNRIATESNLSFNDLMADLDSREFTAAVDAAMATGNWENANKTIEANIKLEMWKTGRLELSEEERRKLEEAAIPETTLGDELGKEESKYWTDRIDGMAKGDFTNAAAAAEVMGVSDEAANLEGKALFDFLVNTAVEEGLAGKSWSNKMKAGWSKNTKKTTEKATPQSSQPFSLPLTQRSTGRFA